MPAPSSPSPSARRALGVRCSSVESSAGVSFVVSGKTFSKQFAALYFTRMLALKAACHRTAEREGYASLLCARLLDVRPGVQCVLTGTLYKEQALKPSILSEYSAQKKGQLPAAQHSNSNGAQLDVQGRAEDGALAALASSRGQWVSASDQCVLEDESGRITLVAADASLISRLCTGVVLAALGVQDEAGKFHISRLLLPDMPPQAQAQPQPPLSTRSPHTPRYVLLVSGLSFGCPTVDPLPLTLLADWCCGAGGGASEAQQAARVGAVVVLGNSLHKFAKKKVKDGLKEVSHKQTIDTAHTSGTYASTR